MNVSDNLDLFESIASDLGVKEAFIEKDQYAMRLMADLAEIPNPKIQLVFAGGTSLSKAHGLIERFSEDLDFKVSLKGEVTRGERRNFRKQVIETINKSEWLKVDSESVKSRDSSRFFQLQVLYPKVFPLPKELRSNIKLEVTFEEPALPPENRSLTSFVSQAKGDGSEVQSIPCVSPVETAADKLSALTWRVLDRDRTQPNDDATLVRHLHDLAALTKTVQTSNTFSELALNAIEKDTARSKTTNPEILSPADRLESMLQTLKSDPLYKDEFSKFVIDLSYAPDEGRPTFKNSLNALEGLIQGVQEQYLSQQTNSAKIDRGNQEKFQSTPQIVEEPKPEDWLTYASALGQGHMIQARVKEVVSAYSPGKPLKPRDRISLKNTFIEFKEKLASIQDWYSTAQQLGKASDHLQKIADTEIAYGQGQPLSADEKQAMRQDKNQLIYNQLSVGISKKDPKAFLVRLVANAASEDIRPSQIEAILSLSPIMQAVQEQKGEQAGQDFIRGVIQDGLNLNKQEQPKRPPPKQQRDQDIDRGPSR